MRLFKEKELLSKNPDYSAVCENMKVFFAHKGGNKIVTDKVGKVIWECLPADADEVQARVKAELNVSSALVSEFLYVLRKAELVSSSMGTDKRSFPAERDAEAEDLVSVIIITRDSEEHIKDCLDSVMNQSYKNLEIAVVDNGSQDQTLNIIRTDFPQVIVYPQKKNLFYPGGVNFGMAKAKGRYLLVLNDDVVLDRDCIFRMHQKIKSKQDVGAVAPMLKFYHLRGIINGIGNQVRNYGWGTDNFIGCVDVGQFGGLEEIPSACFGAVLLDKQAVEDVGGLDERYFAYYEDVDWSFRCWLRGWGILAEPEAVVYHKFGAYWKTMERKLKWVARGRMRLVLKIFRGRILLGFVKRYLKEDIKNVLSLLRKKEVSAVASYLKAYLSLFWSLPEVWFKRIKIMRRKKPGVREADVLRLNPIWYECQDKNNLPKIDSGVIFGYYKWELRKIMQERG